jgi:hypothetical protein
MTRTTMSRSLAGRWFKGFSLSVLTVTAASGLAIGQDSRPQGGRYSSESPSDVIKNGDPRDASGRFIDDGVQRYHPREEERLAFVKRTLDNKKATLDESQRWMQNAKDNYERECQAIKSKYWNLMDQDRVFKNRMFQCPNGHPASLCDHTLLKLRFMQLQTQESARLKKAGRMLQERIDKMKALEVRYQQVETQYQRDLTDYLAKKRSYDTDMAAYGAAKGTAAGASGGQLIFDDQVKRDGGRL